MSGSVGSPELIIIAAIVVMALLVVWPSGRICRRVGFSPWLGVLAIVPFANILLLWFIAMVPWPATDSHAGV